MKNSVKAVSLALAAALALPLCACAAAGPDGAGMPIPDYDDMSAGMPDGFDIPENYVHESVIEQPFVSAEKTPDSYFSLDRNTASY